jgi:long-chain acyl-CoA synthetase
VNHANSTSGIPLLSTEPSASLALIDPERASAFWARGAVLAGRSEDVSKAIQEDVEQTSLAELLKISPARRPLGTAVGSDRACVLFTSGTTRAPKGAMLSHANLAAQLDDVTSVLSLGPDARIANGLVLSHTDGLIQGPLLAAWSGATLLRPDRFRVDGVSRMLRFLSEHRATHVIGAPTIYELIDRFALEGEGFGPDIRILLSSAAPLSPALWDRLERRFRAAVVNQYGMTETVAASHFAGPFDSMGARYSIGQPVGCEARICDPETGAEVEPEGIGELCVRGASVFQGYLGNLEATAQRLRGGWLRTGDLARKLANGSYRIEGRISTAFNSGGFLIMPEEVDDALLRAPRIRDAKTVGVKNDAFGAVAVSFVVFDGPDDTANLFDHCRAQLESWKVPKKIVPIDSIPVLPSGKADMQQLRNRATQHVQARPGQPLLSDELVKVLLEELFHMDPGTVEHHLGPEEIPGWDSYSHTMLILELEERLGMQITAREAQSIETVGDVLAFCRACSNVAPSAT